MQVGGGKPVPYIRASSAAKTVEDHCNLEMWARRNVVYGVSRDQASLVPHPHRRRHAGTWADAHKKLVDRIHEDAAHVAQAHKGADIGTAVHRLTARVDRGEEVVAGPYRPASTPTADACPSPGSPSPGGWSAGWCATPSRWPAPPTGS